MLSPYLHTTVSKTIQLFIAEIPTELTSESDSCDDQQAGWGRCFSAKRFREFSASRKLLNQTLETGWVAREYHNRPPTLHNSDETETRALSISHSNNWVAVAIAPVGNDINVGVDIEPTRRHWTAEKAEFFCNPQQCEKGLALREAEQDFFFTRLWTQKEAFFKATQKAFVARGFDNDDRMQSHTFAEDFQLSVYSDPALELSITQIELGTA